MTEPDAPAAAADAPAVAPAGGSPPDVSGERSGHSEPGDWRDTLDPDLQRYAERFASAGDAVKTARELRRKLSTAVQLPAPDAPREQTFDILNRLGRPETADGYDVSPPEALPDWVDYADEGVQEAQRSFLDAMHAAGATQDVVDAALGWYWAQLAESETARDRMLDAEIENAQASLRREWGGDYARNAEHAGRAITAFGGDELHDALDRYGLSRHPPVIRAFARIGRSMGEDDMVTGPISETTRDQLRQRAEALVAQDDYWTSEAHQREMREIMQQLYGSGEAGPDAG